MSALSLKSVVDNNMPKFTIKSPVMDDYPDDYPDPNYVKVLLLVKCRKFSIMIPAKNNLFRSNNLFYYR